MREVIVGIIKRWGVKLVLREISEIMSNGNEKERVLSRDIRSALDRFEGK